MSNLFGKELVVTAFCYDQCDLFLVQFSYHRIIYVDAMFSTQPYHRIVKASCVHIYKSSWVYNVSIDFLIDSTDTFTILEEKKFRGSIM